MRNRYLIIILLMAVILRNGYCKEKFIREKHSPSFKIIIKEEPEDKILTEEMDFSSKEGLDYLTEDTDNVFEPKMDFSILYKRYLNKKRNSHINFPSLKNLKDISLLSQTDNFLLVHYTFKGENLLTGFSAKSVNEPDEIARIYFSPVVKKIKSWQLKIVDSNGKDIISFQGKKRLPEYVSLDSKEKSKFEEKKIYSPVLFITDKKNKIHTFPGKPFSFEKM